MCGFLDCDFPDCSYKEEVKVRCWRHLGPGYKYEESSDSYDLEQTETYTGVCQYCYQTPDFLHSCEPIRNCSVTASPPNRLVRTICRVPPDTVCMGKRNFYKKVPCNWTSGNKWSTAFILRRSATSKWMHSVMLSRQNLSRKLYP